MQLPPTSGLKLGILLGVILCVVTSLVGSAADIDLGGEPGDPVAKGELPQYIFFNKSPTHADPMRWTEKDPNSFSPASCEEIPRLVGTRGHDRLRVGVSYPFSILEYSPEQLSQCIAKLLDSARSSDVPVLITLDGQNWWESRSDLWNWWDQALPGYSPANRGNVEWTAWGPQHAVKIGWRNWGQQIRVRPAPNIASRRFLAEHWKAYDAIVPLIARWYRDLPKDRKYLFGGLKVGWEASVNVNAYYYPRGNQVFEQSPMDSSKDPIDHERAMGWKEGRPTLGYAAASTEKIRTSGQLTVEDVGEVVHRYLERLSRAAVKRGIPKHLVFTHQGGTYAPWDKHLSFKPAMNDFSIPGWSLYSHDPVDCGSLAADLEGAGRQQWAASEWWRVAETAEQWQRSFEASLHFKSCRFVCVYNWESFKTSPAGLQGVRELVEQSNSAPQSR
jgi:hypothetical protein